MITNHYLFLAIFLQLAYLFSSPSIHRPRPTGRAGRWAHLPLRHLRLPAVLRGHLAHPPGGARHRTGGRHGIQYRGAPGAGCLPAGCPHQEDQSRSAGKFVQTTQGGRAGKAAQDQRQPRAEEEALLADLVKCAWRRPGVGRGGYACILVDGVERWAGNKAVRKNNTKRRVISERKFMVQECFQGFSRCSFYVDKLSFSCVRVQIACPRRRHYCARKQYIKSKFAFYEIFS